MRTIDILGSQYRPEPATGFFDFLKSKKPPNSKGSVASPHYFSAHYALRQIAPSGASQFLAVVTSPIANPFLAAVLQTVENRTVKRFPFRLAALTIQSVRIMALTSVIIQLPDPHEIAEAFMPALVLTMDTLQSSASSDKQSAGRCFTLEKGFTMTDQSRTVLAEWTIDRHANYGDVSRATVDAFCQAIAEQD